MNVFLFLHAVVIKSFSYYFLSQCRWWIEIYCLCK